VLEAQDGERIVLRPHSFVLLPSGVTYRIESANSSPSTRVDRARLGAWFSHETIPTVRVGEGSEGIETACGELSFDAATGGRSIQNTASPVGRTI
jgi:AraC family transcriptional regulator, activator of mtrCDE